MRLGTAKVDITPPVGVELSGFVARMSPSTAVADRLYARALIMESKGRICGIVSLDLLAVGQGSVERVRRELNSRGIDASNVMFCASHTHSGPATVELRNCGRISAEYLDHMEDFLVRAVSEAYGKCNGCNDDFAVEYAETPVPGLVMNRRDDADGPVDIAARILRCTGAQDGSRVYVVNFACHGVCLCDTGITGDYVSHLCRELEETGRSEGSGETLALFANGPSGDINPRHRDSREAAIRMGQGIARSILELPQTSWQPIDSRFLDGTSAFRAFPFQSLPTQGELADYVASEAKCMNVPDKTGRKVARSMAGWALDVARKLDEGTAKTHETAEVTVLRIGEVLVISLPGEIFTAIGMEIRERLAGNRVLIAAHANGSIGYVPTPGEYARGGYELDAYKWYDYPAVLAPECSSILIDTAVSLAKGLSEVETG